MNGQETSKAGEYLRRLGLLAERQGLDEQTKLAVCQEIAAHLDASIQARVEMGLPYDLAECEAVQALGKPSSYVGRLAESDSGKIRAGRRILKLGMAFGVATWLTIGFNSQVPALVAGGLAFWIAAVAFQRRRFELARLGVIGLSVGLGIWLLMATVYVPIGGRHVVGLARASELNAFTQSMRQRIATKNGQADWIESVVGRISGSDFLSAATRCGLRQGDFILVPDIQRFDGQRQLRLVAASADSASFLWKHQAPSVARWLRDSSQIDGEELQRVRAYADRPIVSRLEEVWPDARMFLPLIVLILWSANLIGGIGGMLYAEGRRLRRLFRSA